MKAKILRRVTLGAVLALALHCPTALAGYAPAPLAAFCGVAGRDPG